MFDTGEPGVSVSGTAIYIRYLDGKQVAIIKASVIEVGRVLGLKSAEAISVAVQAFGGWITDNWRPDRPASAIHTSMRSVLDQRERQKLMPRLQIPDTTNLPSIHDGGWEE